MSMTDGHIFFDEALFDEGHRPAVNTFLSVTRVGRQVQSKLHKSLNRELTGFMNLLRKHEKFVHFGAEISEGIKTSLETGSKLEAFFNQQPRFVYPQKIQYLLFTLLWGGLINTKQLNSLRFLGEKMVDSYEHDTDFRSYIDGLFSDDMDFNDLMAKITAEQKSIKEVLGMTS
jgi:F0F1-type ATP synthase alpha subunit